MTKFVTAIVFFSWVELLNFRWRVQLYIKSKGLNRCINWCTVDVLLKLRLHASELLGLCFYGGLVRDLFDYLPWAQRTFKNWKILSTLSPIYCSLQLVNLPKPFKYSSKFLGGKQGPGIRIWEIKAMVKLNLLPTVFFFVDSRKLILEIRVKKSSRENL